jgi:hypothetical protein
VVLGYWRGVEKDSWLACLGNGGDEISKLGNANHESWAVGLRTAYNTVCYLLDIISEY